MWVRLSFYSPKALGLVFGACRRLIPNPLRAASDGLCLPGTQGVPGRVNIGIEVFLRGLASANAVAWVIVGKDVAVDARAEADVEAAHLAQVYCVAMGKQHCESARGNEDEKESEGALKVTETWCQ